MFENVIDFSEVSLEELCLELDLLDIFELIIFLEELKGAVCPFAVLLDFVVIFDFTDFEQTILNGFINLLEIIVPLLLLLLTDLLAEL